MEEHSPSDATKRAALLVLTCSASPVIQCFTDPLLVYNKHAPCYIAVCLLYSLLQSTFPCINTPTYVYSGMYL